MVAGDGQWGGVQEDGTITGIIGLVARHEADLAIDEITITGTCVILLLYQVASLLLMDNRLNSTLISIVEEGE